METIGQLISKERLLKRWTQERLAAEIGVSQSVLSSIENDHTVPKLDTVAAIAEKLDIPIFKLLPASVNNVFNHIHDQASGITNNYNHSQEIQSLLENMVQQKDEIIAGQKEIQLLQTEIIATLKKEVEALHAQLSSKGR